MIPTMLAAGIAVGFLPQRFTLVGVLLLSVSWPLILLAGNVEISVVDVLLAMILAFTNAAIGALASWSIVKAVRVVRT